MQFSAMHLIKTGCAIGAMILVNCAAISTANAQEKPPTPVGWEVRSTNTPGGGGELKSQGVTGKETPFFLVKMGPSVAGSAVVNMVIVYYASAEDLALAKKLEAEAKKKKEEEKKKKEEEKKKTEDEKKKKGDSKKSGGKQDPPKKESPPDVPTFDPRTHELKDGKVVPKDPKQHSPKAEDHKFCDTPDRFECGEHFQWWLKSHEHRNAPKSAGGEPNKLDVEVKPVETPFAPRIIMTGTVVAGEDTQIRVVDSKGAFLSGVVVALPNGETTTTDAEGKATVKAPKNSDTMLLTLAGLGVAASAWVRDSGEVPAVQTLPHLDPPSFIQPGHEAEFGWTGGNGGQIMIDGKPATILASSPTGCVVQVPGDLAPGAHTLSYQTGGSIADVQPVESVSLQVEPPKTMMVGQKATYTVRILGTDRKMNLRLSNLSPSIASLVGSASRCAITSSGGKNNMAKIEVQTHAMGQVLVAVSLVDFDAIDCIDYMVAAQRSATTVAGR